MTAGWVDEQVVRAFMVALMGEGVSPELIERAAFAAAAIGPGGVITTLCPVHDPTLVHAFVSQQTHVLGRTA